MPYNSGQMLIFGLRRTILDISSMTGFARQEGNFSCKKNSFSWFFEVKSVNGKSLDLKIKLPSWLDNRLSPMLKNAAAKYFTRGNVSVYLDLESTAEEQVKINDALLEQLTEKAIALSQKYGNALRAPSASELLAVKGVAEIEETVLDEEETNAFAEALRTSFEEVCAKLQEDRKSEGVKIRKALLDIMNKIANIVEKAEKIAEGLPAVLRKRLTAQLEEFPEAGSSIGEDRLAQEIVLLVTRADIREEIDRLKVHIKTAEDLLGSGGAVGRRLDFLCQELNREANTTCSKSCDIELTNLGMELKTLIEQFREQVQNIE